MNSPNEKSDITLDLNSHGATVLAVGGELKNTVCLLEGTKARLSHCHGDLKSLDEYEAFQASAQRFSNNNASELSFIAHDLHPEYLSTQWAKEQGLTLVGVQHHHAHLASCMAEKGLTRPVIGIIMDGTGFGTDGTIWGAEILIGDYAGYERFASFEPMPLPGGDKAVMEPWRTGVGYLTKSFGKMPELPFLRGKNYQVIQEIVGKGINTPLTSSCGRLFDAVSAICGVRDAIEFEAQAAIEFMQLANDVNAKPYSVHCEADAEGILRFQVSALMKEIVADLLKEVSPSDISSRFHATLARFYQQIAVSAMKNKGVSDVVLSGGVFQNGILFNKSVELLQKAGLKVHTHNKLSPNDSSIALGQAMVARASMKQNSVV